MLSRSYVGCQVRQREHEDVVPFFSFIATVKDIREWAGVRRVAEQEHGTQRLFRKSRGRAIRTFFESSPINTIPTSVLVAFEPGAAEFRELDSCELDEVESTGNGCGDRLSWGVLEFSFQEDTADHNKPALIVDGQHRLFGMSELENENLPVSVVALVDAAKIEQAFQFVVINNKGTRVPVDDIKSIIAELDEDDLKSRLLDAGVRYAKSSPLLRRANRDDTSPFQGLLDWPLNREGDKVIPTSAVEKADRYLQQRFRRELTEDDDSRFEILAAIWRGVRRNYRDLFSGDAKLLKKVCMTALNEFIVDGIARDWNMGRIDIFQVESVEDVAYETTKRIPNEFWERDWTIRLKDNANVREFIRAEIEEVMRNVNLGNKWDEDVEILVDEETS